MTIAALILIALAGALHVYIFAIESVVWRSKRTWRIFGIKDETTAEIARPWAFNQGFYNLFLAIGVVIGLALFWAGDAGTTAEVAGRALVLFSLGSMLAAALVLVTSGAKYLRPAAIQGTLPLIGFVLFLFA